METSHKIAGPRAIRQFNVAIVLLAPAALCVAVPLIIDGFSWSNVSIFIGMAIMLGVPFFMTRTLRSIHESDESARAAGDEPLYLERLLRDFRSSLARRR